MTKQSIGAAKRILVVDDEDKVLFVMSRALARLSAQCEVQTARTGRQALEMAQASPFDLIVTDLRMPDMDGLALTKALRGSGNRATVIWMTGYSCRAQEAEMKRLDVYRCLDKPIEITEIRRTVSEAILGEGSTS